MIVLQTHVVMALSVWTGLTTSHVNALRDILENAAASVSVTHPDSKVHGANMGPIWGRQDLSGPHVGPMNFAIWDETSC